MKIIKKTLIVALVAFVLIQFYRPEKNNAEYRNVAAFEAKTQVTPEIKTILEQTCYDCHSDKTEYPWYAEVSPFSLMIADHVEDGMKHLNFSKWDSYNDKKKDHKLDEVIEEVEEGKMPEDGYALIHGDLSPEEKEAIMNWGRKARANLDL